MKYFRKLPLLIFCMIVSSCCHKKDCEEQIDKFELKYFTLQETDSIIVKSYQKNSNFTLLFDSFFTSGVRPDVSIDKIIVRLNNQLNYDFEYKVDVISINKTYHVSGFSKKKNECSSCFPGRDTYYDLLDTYSVNGSQKYSEENGVILER